MGDRAALDAAEVAGLDPIGDLRRRWAGQPVLGWSTAGHAVDDRLCDGSLVATVLRFERTQVRSDSLSFDDTGTARRAGRALATALAADDLRFVLFATGGVGCSGSAVLDGLADVLPDADVLGVLAADERDDHRGEHPWTLLGGGRSGAGVSAIGFYGDALEVSCAVGSSAHPVGPERVVTSSHGNVIHRIDGIPPAELYRDHLGDPWGDDLGANAAWLPLAVRDLDDRTTVHVVRGVEPSGAVTVSGDVLQGSSAQLCWTPAAELVDGAADVADAARLDDAAVCLVVSSVGRRRVLGERAEDEVAAVHDHVTTRTIACWGHGSVRRHGGVAGVHDHAICIAVLRETPTDTTPDATDTAPDTRPTATTHPEEH